jgi:enamine deaminase RidA (YjgF/YER057c/UK114 family)
MRYPVLIFTSKEYTMKKILIFLFVLVNKISLAQSDKNPVSFLNPAELSTPRGYTHVTITDLGNCKMVMISGQVPLDRNGNLVGKDDFAKQTEQVFINIRHAVTAAGGTMDQLVKIGVYVLDASQLQVFRDIRNKFVNVKNPPASTLVQVSRLFREDVLVEIEAMAIIPK